jgi:hypothetical protein
MKNSFKILFLVFIMLLAGVLLFTRSLYNTPGGGLFRLNVKNARVLIIKGGGESIVLKKKGNVWRITNRDWRPAEESRVESALRAILGFTGQDIVSRNMEKQIIYQVNPELGTTVLFSSGGMPGTNNGFIVGKISQDYMNSYVRKMGSSLTLKEKGFLQGQFAPDIISWEKHSVFNSSPEFIATRIMMSNLSFSSNPMKLLLEKKGNKGTWMIISPARFRVNNQAMDETLRNMKYLRLVDYVSVTNRILQRTNEIFQSLSGTLQVEYDNGRKERLLIGSPSTNGLFYGKIAGRNDIFIVDKVQLNRLINNFNGLTQGKGPVQ